MDVEKIKEGADGSAGVGALSVDVEYLLIVARKRG